MILYSHIIVLLLSCGSIVNAARKFRSEKVNFIYDKALQHVADRQRLTTLEGELTQYDNMYMSTKDLHSAGKVGELNKELSKVDKKLVTLLEKYDLEQTVQAFKEKMKHKNEYQLEEENSVLPSEKFKDERLQKLWRIAMESKFSDNEIKELHAELKEVERKTAVYEDALQDLNKVPHENSLNFDESHGLDEKTRKLKDAHADMHSHYQQVKDRVASESATTFESDKVKNMWKLAQSNANFTAHDLQIVKDELTHFDKQLKKMEFHKTELDAARGREKQGGKSALLENVEDTEMEAKHEKMDRKLRKLEKYLQTKITHSEL